MKTPTHIIQASFTSGTLFAAIMLFLNPATAFAQDIKFTDPVSNTVGVGDPAFATKMSKDNLAYMPDIPTYAYIHVSMFINQHGVIGGVPHHPYSTDPELLKAFPPKKQNIRFKPASNTSGWDNVDYVLIYNPANAPETGPDAAPRLLNVVAAYVLRSDLIKINKVVWDKGGVVWLNATVNAKGVVKKCILDKENFPWAVPIQNDIYKAVKQWKFAPARRDGKSVPAEISLPVYIVPVNRRRR